MNKINTWAKKHPIKYKRYLADRYKNNSEEIKKQHKEYYNKNKSKCIATNKAWYNNHRRKMSISHKAWHILDNYNITEKDYKLMLDKQNGKCAICEKKESAKLNNKLTRLRVDHNHKTNKIRGLLCHRCNVSLGLLKEDPIIINKMLEYLKC